jgi:3D (Asp-Asp-Asp) domain-containing protein
MYLIYFLVLVNICSSLDISKLVSFKPGKLFDDDYLSPGFPLLDDILNPTLPNNNDDNKSPALKKVELTYYWITRESDFPTGGEQVNVKACSQNRAFSGTISKKFYQSLHLEGTGELRNGAILNCFNDDCTCFDKVDGPMGTWHNILEPYISIAANDMPHGTIIYIKELDGVKLPSGQAHNGCARVDDTSYSFGANHIDLFSFYKTNYETIQKKFSKERVSIQVGANCKLLKYSK